MVQPSAVIFDVGNVLFDWNPRFLYERLIGDGQTLDAFLSQVATREWHFQHDAGRPFAETSAELAALHPEYAEWIALWGPRFNDQVPGPLPGMVALVEELDAAGVPLFAITNFSAEFWPPFRAQWAGVFDRFRDILVSGEVRLVKPDPAIYRMALDRFGLAPHDAVFVDDNRANVDAAAALGIHAVLFDGADRFRAQLVGHGLLG